ncbi:hypothetical protein BD413DRAFT_574676 [Trametes elegans]|nr:hypothetical protein BD413DRAFT_574676 [Trametes elegans]
MFAWVRSGLVAHVHMCDPIPPLKPCQPFARARRVFFLPFLRLGSNILGGSRSRSHARRRGAPWISLSSQRLCNVALATGRRRASCDLLGSGVNAMSLSFRTRVLHVVTHLGRRLPAEQRAVVVYEAAEVIVNQQRLHSISGLHVGQIVSSHFEHTG